jgi:hypothetical protein
VSRLSREFVAVFAVISLALVLGCGSSNYVPATDSSRKSLDAALAAWRDGKAVGQVESASPKIQAEDGEWRANKKLTAFEIVGEEPGQSPDAPRRFKVKLTLEGSAPVDTVFVVFGKDPVYVYRDKYYETHFSKM